MPEELRIQNGKNTIYGVLYKPEGTGKHPAIILSHGYNGTNADWVKECSFYVQNGYAAYAFDFCGGSVNSKSSGASTDMTIDTEKSDLLVVFQYISAMDIVDASQVFLFGGSQGGFVTALAAEELRDQVRAVALYFPALCIPDNWREAYPNPEQAPETFDFWGMRLGKKFVAGVHSLSVFDTIGHYPNDVLILHGDVDPVVPYSYSEQAVKAYANARLIKMEGEGHGFTPAGAKTAMEAVLGFLKEHTAKCDVNMR